MDDAEWLSSFKFQLESLRGLTFCVTFKLKENCLIQKYSLIIGWCRVAIAIFASKIFSLDFFQALHCHLLSSLIQVKHGLILWFKLQAPNSSLCYNSSALSPNLSTYTSDINTDSFKETFECYHFYTFVYMPSQSV